MNRNLEDKQSIAVRFGDISAKITRYIMEEEGTQSGSLFYFYHRLLE